MANLWNSSHPPSYRSPLRPHSRGDPVRIYWRAEHAKMRARPLRRPHRRGPGNDQRRPMLRQMPAHSRTPALLTSKAHSRMNQMIHSPCVRSWESSAAYLFNRAIFWFRRPKNLRPCLAHLLCDGCLAAPPQPHKHHRRVCVPATLPHGDAGGSAKVLAFSG